MLVICFHDAEKTVEGLSQVPLKKKRRAYLNVQRRHCLRETRALQSRWLE
jgi:hypothetical protein